MSTEKLLELDAVSKHFAINDVAGANLARWLRGEKRSLITAVDQLSLNVCSGEIVALVGESGSGKSTIARIAVGLYAPDSGHRRLHIEDLAVQMIFQDAAAALNPRLRVQELLAEAPRVHGLITANDEKTFVAELLSTVGLEKEMADRYPHQLSGGQKARVGIARALAVQPQLLVCDEILASLDVLLQRQILDLLRDLQQRLGLACLFISHDLGVVQQFSERMNVMYMGRIVESGPTPAVFGQAHHPYTRALLAAMPRLNALPLNVLAGEPPSPLQAPSGCHFQSRCPQVMDICRRQMPPRVQVGPDHHSACHLPVPNRDDALTRPD